MSVLEMTRGSIRIGMNCFDVNSPGLAVLNVLKNAKLDEISVMVLIIRNKILNLVDINGLSQRILAHLQ